MTDADELPPLTVAVAELGPVIAMKLQSIMNRGSAKGGPDLLDIVRLTLDRDCGPTSRDYLEAAGHQCARGALLHARRWFAQTADDEVRLVGDLLVAALAS